MIRLHSFSIGYGDRLLLENAEAVFGAGSLTALIGRNGTGKSTLLRAMAGLNRSYGGRIDVGGRDMRGMNAPALARTLAFVTTERTRIANLSCGEVVALGRAPYTDWIGRLRPQDREVVAKSLALVGMQD